jgi:hypothetical protein
MRKNQMLKHLLKYCVSGAAICIGSVYAGELNFTASTASVAENTSTLTISVARTGDASATASVKVTSTAGTASSPGDFTAVDTTLNWAAGNSDSKTVDITIVDNNTVNTDKTFTLGLSAVTGDTIGATSSLTATITDFEEGVLQFNGAIFQAAEDSKVAKIKVTRTGGSDGAIGATVSFTDVSAVKGSDYFGADKTVTLANAVSEATLEVTLKDDSIGEPTESFTATMATPTGGATLGAQTTASVEIFDTDADFTTEATKISITTANVTQPDVVDLNQASLLNPTKTYLELINEIPLLAVSKLSASQPAGGLVEIPFGNDKFYLRPIRISRNAQSLSVGVRTIGSNLYRFVTSSDLVIDMHPAIASLESLQSSLAELAMPNLLITDQGNMTIQKDQGVPKIEENENGELVLSDSFYERWHVRALAMVTPSPYVVTGIYQQGHPTVPGQGTVSLYFRDGPDYMVQHLHSAPANDSELEVAIRRRIGFTQLSFGDYGTVSFSVITPGAGGTAGATKYSIIADYTLTKLREFTPDLAGFFNHTDANGDGLSDFLMVYSNGDSQLFLTFLAE